MIDLKSLVIGIIGTTLVFVLIGAKSQNKNLGDITVNSITILDDGTGGNLKIYNSEGVKTSQIGNSESGGYLITYNSDSMMTSILGGDQNGKGFLVVGNNGNIETRTSDMELISQLGKRETGGYLATYNTDGEMTSYLGVGEGVACQSLPE